MHPEYSQPHFYHFTSDSLKLVKLASSVLESTGHILDLCSGCGVIGIETALKLSSYKTLSFLEEEESFEEHIEENIKKHNVLNTRIEIQNLKEFKPDTQYDLILCNPPYFIRGSGRESPNYKRQKCRTLETVTPVEIFEFIYKNLSPDGKSFIIIPYDHQSWRVALDKYIDCITILDKNERLYFCKLTKSNLNK